MDRGHALMLVRIGYAPAECCVALVRCFRSLPTQKAMLMAVVMRLATPSRRQYLRFFMVLDACGLVNQQARKPALTLTTHDAPNIHKATGYDIY